MCFGVNVGLDTRCVHRKFQVYRLSTKKVILEKLCAKKNHWNRVTFAHEPGNFARPRKIAWLRGSALQA